MENLSYEAVIRMLEEQRAAGRQFLEESEIPDKGVLLCSALKHSESPLVRQILCNILASHGDASLLPDLLTALDDPDNGVVAAAADAIGNNAYDQQIEESLRDKLGARLLALGGAQHPVSVRTAAIYGLGLMRFAPASSFLLAALNDPAPEVRWGSAEALAHIGDRKFVPSLRARLSKETHERVSACIKAALAELSEIPQSDKGTPEE
jgi:HEAT repeat protein